MSIAKKLFLKADDTIAVAGAPAEVRKRIEADVGKSRVLSRARAGTKALITFVSSKADVDDAASAAITLGNSGAAIWFAYPKGRKDTDISRDKGWNALNARGWVPISLFAIDDAWSALRFKHDPKLHEERIARGTLPTSKTKQPKRPASRKGSPKRR